MWSRKQKHLIRLILSPEKGERIIHLLLKEKAYPSKYSFPKGAKEI